MAYSVNKAILIGNLTRDPELRYTPQGTAVCSFGIATNRSWTTPEGEARDMADFHNIVAWRKLAEICNKLLSKGRKVYVSGRIQTRDWTGDDGVKRYRTEIVIDEMIVLDAPPATVAGSDRIDSSKKTKGDSSVGSPEVSNKGEKNGKEKVREEAKRSEKDEESKEVKPDDIPF